MILLFIFLIIIGPALFWAIILAPLLLHLETIATTFEFEEQEERELSSSLDDEELMICPKCEVIREGRKCPKCKVKLITMDEYEENW